jgi:predicted TIM-barrel fold metal-dependent hydrolase
MELPRLISVDDHVVEPPDLWERHLPTKFRARGPRVERVKGTAVNNGRHFTFVEADDGQWGDRWVYEDITMPITTPFVAVCFDRDDVSNTAVLFDDMFPGCTQPVARVADMDANHVDASLCFPTFPRFCGQTFLEAQDKELALACVQAYNDWMIDEWCGGDARGRLIPLTLLPLWDPDLAAVEVERCAAKGSHAVCFSEGPTALGLPSVFTEHWDPLWHACEATDTTVNMHIGSSSTFPKTSADAPPIVAVTLTFEGASHALVDWLCSGTLERFHDLRIVLSEGQVGWMPFLLERLDHVWDHARAYGGIRERVPHPPSSYIADRVFGCIFDDFAGLALRDQVGMGQIMIETDYPHGDSTWPHSRETVEHLVRTAGLDDAEIYALVRGNAIRCYGLDRYFGVAA